MRWDHYGYVLMVIHISKQSLCGSVPPLFINFTIQYFGVVTDNSWDTWAVLTIVKMITSYMYIYNDDVYDRMVYQSGIKIAILILH